MIAKFAFLWLLGTIITFFWLYVSSKAERNLGKFMLKALSISGAVALLFIVLSMSINNLSGI
jgi:hypothetical protein